MRRFFATIIFCATLAVMLTHAKAGVAQTTLRYMPANTQAFVTANITQVKDSEFGPPLLSFLYSDKGLKDVLEGVQESTGFDVRKHVSEVSTFVTEQEQVLFVAEGSFPAAKIETWLREKSKKSVTKQYFGGVQLVVIEKTHVLAFDGRCLLIGGIAEVKAGLSNRVKGAPMSKRMAQVLQKEGFLRAGILLSDAVRKELGAEYPGAEQLAAASLSVKQVGTKILFRAELIRPEGPSAALTKSIDDAAKKLQNSQDGKALRLRMSALWHASGAVVMADVPKLKASALLQKLLP